MYFCIYIYVSALLVVGAVVRLCNKAPLSPLTNVWHLSQSKLRINFI